MLTFCWGQRGCRCAQVFFLLLMTGISCERAAGQAKAEEKKSDEQRAAIVSVRQFSRVVPNAFGDYRVWSSRYHFNVSLFPASSKFAQASGFRQATHSSTGRLASAFATHGSPLVGRDPTWTGGTGNWSNAAKWTGGVPTATTDASIDGGKAGASPVTLDIAGAQVRNLTIDSDDSLNFNNGTSLTVNGSSISNAGKITLNSTGSATELIIANTGLTLSGGGSIAMSNNANNFIVGSGAGATLINQQTIQGAGTIESLELVNTGTVNANSSAGLTINPSGVLVNSGTIEATGGTLALNSTIVNNTGGTISASGQTLQVNSSTINGGAVTLTGTSTLQLSNSTIENGTLTNSNKGTIEALGFTTDTLASTINNPAGGVIKIDNGAVLNLQSGNYPTLGTVQLNSTGSATELQVVAGNVTLSGGSVTLSNNANNFIFGALGSDALTNQETIQGAGNIGNGRLTLVNSGTINANQSAGLTIAANGGTTNTGTIEATGGTLAFSGTIVNNNGGTVSSNGQTLQVTNSTINGGTVTLTGKADLQLSNSTIQGGTLNNSATGTIEALSFTTDTLGDTISNPAGGVIKVDNGAVLNLQNGSYPSAGSIQINSTGSATELQLVGGNVTLSGGSVTLSNNANNFIFGAVGTDTLTNQETIQGAGNIGNGRLTLVNSGTINANQSAGLTIAANGGTTNTGTIEATGGTLAFSGTIVNNNGGTISSNGQKLQATNSTINGGTVTLTGAANLQLSNSTIQGGTLNNSATGTIEALSFTNDTLAGTISNSAGGLIKVDNGGILNLHNGNYPTLGTVQLNSTGSATELQLVGGNVTVSGGSVTLSNNANNFIFGAVGTDTLTNQETIQGAGNIGNGRLTLVNSGTINANQSAGLTIAANGGATNTGTMKATGGTLAFSNTIVNNNSGTISSNGQNLQVTGSTINGGTVTLTGAANLQLSNSTIQGGTLNNSATGTIEALSFTNDTLGGTVSNPAGGLIKVDNGGVLNLQNGAYTNAGSLQVNSTGSTTELVVNGSNVTLAGGGSVALSNNANNFILGKVTTNILTNQETIQGAGNIGNGSMGLINSGTILANQGTALIIQPDLMGFNNQGTLSVNTGDLLHVSHASNGLFFNFLGNTLTGGTYNVSGTLRIDQLGKTGGEIVNNAANIILNGASSSFEDSAGLDALTNLSANSTAGSGFTVTSGKSFTTAGTFTNNGTLTVGSGSTFKVNGNLTNFSGTTLTGGTYSVTGTLQFNGANIVTNAANITLNGTSSQIINQSSANGLANFATNTASGVFSLQGSRTFTTAGNFSNAGKFTIGSGSKFTVGGTGTTYTQTVGSTTDDGTLTVSGTGSLTLSGGGLFGTGNITGAVKSSGTVNPGNSSTSPGILTETGAYTQNSGGTLNISIGGTTAGTQYDQLNPSTASLGGVLTTNLINGFTPTIGQSFTIMKFTSKTGTFASCDGRSGGTTCPINATEHFNITYNPTGVVLTVASGASVPLGQPVSLGAIGLRTSGMSGQSASGMLQSNISAYHRRGAMNATELAALGTVVHQDRLTGIAAFTTPNSYRGPAPPRFTGAASTVAVPGGINRTSGLLHSGSHSPRTLAPRIMEYHVDLLPILGTSPKHAFGALAGHSGFGSFVLQ